MVHTKPQQNPSMVHGLRSTISALRLSNFRNYADLNLHLDGRSVILTGANGAGKTNILEAISLLSPGRGLRNAKMGELALASSIKSGWSVVADLTTPHTTHRIGTGTDSAAPRSKRLIQIDEKKSAQTDLAEYCTIAWLTPAMDRLFVESRSERRRFLDRLVYAFYPVHLQHIQALEKAQRERLRLLSFGRIDQEWIGTLERQIAENSISISRARAEYIERLNDHIGQFGPDFPKLRLDLQSKIWADIAAEGDNNAVSLLQDRLKDSRERDRLVRSTREGAGRDDFTAFHIGKNRLAGDCSTGEQKIALIAIILGHSRLLITEKRKTPILLLDELAAHLDDRHRAALANVIENLGIQAFVSGADAALFGDWKSAQILAVQNAQITPITHS
ncbi:MAG: DNA replication/repair protein RecF [Alphaproteobacteria bacterium]|nr:MAG: DNA replication/repair protein RecF [Alphaproteobacteria bacterium]